jgi:hypothetical protein
MENQFLLVILYRSGAQNACTAKRPQDVQASGRLHGLEIRKGGLL